MKIIHIFGTRPEAIKMVPVVKALSKSGRSTNVVCVTAQHREMLDQVLNFFEIVPDYDLRIMQNAQSLCEVTSRILTLLPSVFSREKPDLVLVHGDTNTTLSGALAAYYHQVSIGHVEAGLRTHDLYSPWPEEGNRVLTDQISTFCFAPTELARKNLLMSGISDEKISVTGNTVVDALLQARRLIYSNPKTLSSLEATFSYLEPNRKLILVTAHRRESFGEGFDSICDALLKISDRTDVEIIFPVHYNPNVRNVITAKLTGRDRIHLIDPVSYPCFVYLMDRAHLILTDSGGVQEEAPSLKKPVLVLRDRTERSEALCAGTIKLVGTNVEKIVSGTTELLDNKTVYEAMSNAVNPYGDGHAAEKIAEIIENA